MKDLLKMLRTRRGLTHAQAAEAIGVVRGTIYAWEEDGKEPDKERLRRIVEVYGASDAEATELARLRAFGASADLQGAA